MTTKSLLSFIFVVCSFCICHGREADSRDEGVTPTGTLPVLHVDILDGDGELDWELLTPQADHKERQRMRCYLEMPQSFECCPGYDGNWCAVASEQEPRTGEIRLRGNFTRRALAKKPFNIYLDHEVAWLGLPSSTRFALMAHADDDFGYCRDYCGFNLAKRIGLPWTPWKEPIELIVNGDYRGLYFLCESVAVEENRVNVAAPEHYGDADDYDTGGYMIELNNYREPGQIILDEHAAVSGHTLCDLLVTLHYPQMEEGSLRWRFLKEQVTNIDRLVATCNEMLWSYLDLDDFARYYIVVELISHVESYHGSTYFFRQAGAGEKWHISPLWDCGQAFNGLTNKFVYNCDPYGTTWIPSVARQKRFYDKVRETWKWFMANRFDGFFDELHTYTQSLSEAAQRDYERWHDVPLPTKYPSEARRVADNRDMERGYQTVYHHMMGKISWLRSQWGNETFLEDVPEPERDDTEAAAFPVYNRMVDGLESVKVNDEVDDLPMYNLQGIRIVNAPSGQPYIKGGKIYLSE